MALPMWVQGLGNGSATREDLKSQIEDFLLPEDG